MSREVSGPILLVKLGGSVITDKSRPFTERMDVIERLAKEIHSARSGSEPRLIVGHGGGSYPHTPAEEFQIHKGLIDKESSRGVALVQDAAARLNRLVVKALIDAGEDAVSVQPSACILAESSRIVWWDIRVLQEMLKIGLLPVVYGDVVLDVEQGCSIASTEEIFFYLANLLLISRIVIGSDVDGVLDYTSKGREKFDVITPSDRVRISASLQGAETVDVTGGMKSKVELLLRLAEEKGVESEILNASRPGLLESALKGRRGLGTIIR
ncbi:MAG: isopentenyl phosphate kinase, partial [Nitrososphaerales archaeon]